MPLFSSNDLGTSSDGSRVEEYCRYCFQEGHFTSDCTMDEMIRLCAQYVNQWNQFTGRSYTRGEAIARMQRQFPLLRRWAQKEETQNEYHKAISRVLGYMHTHLNENPGIDTLSGIACVSPYHFHRMFKAIIGENTGAYQLRLRMEYVAVQLRSGHHTLEQLAEETGYNGIPALSKAFRKYYGMAPSVYRSSPSEPVSRNVSKERFRTAIRDISPFTVICTPVSGEEPVKEACAKAWGAVEMYAREKALLGDNPETIGLSFDGHNPSIRGRHLFYACLSVLEPFISEDPLSFLTIDGGLYAVFLVKGSYQRLSELYRFIYFEWLPVSRYAIRSGLSFEKYLDNPLVVPEQEARTEVYLPVTERK